MLDKPLATISATSFDGKGGTQSETQRASDSASFEGFSADGARDEASDLRPIAVEPDWTGVNFADGVDGAPNGIKRAKMVVV
jgi:hypothetical protein